MSVERGFAASPRHLHMAHVCIYSWTDSDTDGVGTCCHAHISRAIEAENDTLIRAVHD
ncbi:hypothetical protein CORC01_07650 [Colletotrichum orchidophilum]|uniref:Uncharacterized protein n=1 Tax=Colletotrichum orchidophilum TaxID=1209926 RepID=A0A1G4B6K2_9PEZI|nr:uncharacterized protein CORC01_07650 [Colletotrichum orchidophilum]OHE97041.1 hypothetical protein CORC01_07650 [Colletotrichum orchidophilum]